MRWTALSFWLLLATAASAQKLPGLRLTVAGPARPALLAPSDCEPDDMPDAPARALRLADGTVQLYATDHVNRVSVGPDLRHLLHQCGVVYQGAHADDPAAFDDRSWITSVWTSDGTTIWALLHNEFHGEFRPALCPTRRYMDCWYNSLTIAQSQDGGRSYQRLKDGPVATLPYRFEELPRGHHGYFNPTGIVSADDGMSFLMTFATEASAQKGGNCLLRSATPAQAGSWRAWDGKAFSVRFIDPYREHVPPGEHVCEPVGLGSLDWPVTSLVRHRETGLFLALMQRGGRDGAVFYATSADLIHWSGRARLMDATGLDSWHCEARNAIAYPSLLDPASPDRTFAIVGREGLLFATRFEPSDCRTFRDRTLVEWPITIVPSGD